jgi:hypothetical protein
MYLHPFEFNLKYQYQGKRIASSREFHSTPLTGAIRFGHLLIIPRERVCNRCSEPINGGKVEGRGYPLLIRVHTPAG